MNWQRVIFNAGIRPHITLAVYDELACQPCDNELARISARTASMSLKFTHLGVFSNSEPVIFAATMPTKELLDFHENLHAVLADESKKPWDLYRPGNWVPHCTLALDFEPEKIGKIIHSCQTLQLPMNVNAVQLGVVEFQPFRDIFNYDLLTSNG